MREWRSGRRVEAVRQRTGSERGEGGGRRRRRRRRRKKKGEEEEEEEEGRRRRMEVNTTADVGDRGLTAFTPNLATRYWLKSHFTPNEKEETGSFNRLYVILSFRNNGASHGFKGS